MEKVQKTLVCCKLEAVTFALEITQATDSQTRCLGGSTSPLVTRGESFSASALLTFGSDSSFSVLCTVGWLAASLAPIPRCQQTPPPARHTQS